jgi:hypothetical protein
MALGVYLWETTASPPHARVEEAMRSAIVAEGGSVDPDGVTLHAADGARVRISGGLTRLEVEQLSPSFCRMLFAGARAANLLINRAGPGVAPLRVAGATGSLRELRLRTQLIANPAALCERLGRDLKDWNQFVADGQKDGSLGPDGQPLFPPPDPGGEPRVAPADAADLAGGCQDFARRFTERGGGTLRRWMISRNAQYGLVWRGDLAMGPTPAEAFRLTCWTSPTGKPGLRFASQPLTMFDPKDSVPPLPGTAEPGEPPAPR